MELSSSIKDKADQPMTFLLTGPYSNKNAALILDKLGDKIQTKQNHNKQKYNNIMFSNELRV